MVVFWAEPFALERKKMQKKKKKSKLTKQVIRGARKDIEKVFGGPSDLDRIKNWAQGVKKSLKSK